MQRKSLWGSYKALNPRTRVLIGVGNVTFSISIFVHKNGYFFFFIIKTQYVN